VPVEETMKLHVQYQCPLPSAFMHVADAQGSPVTVAQRQVMDGLRCTDCTGLGRVSPKPTVSMPTLRRPGKSLAMDVGDFHFDVDGHGAPKKALVMVDQFSLFVAGPLFRNGDTTSAAVSDIFIEKAPGDYERVLVDQGRNLNSEMLQTLTARLGGGLDTVPREAHWANPAEKAIDLVREELKKVLRLRPIQHPSRQFLVAMRSLNTKMMGTGCTRAEVHYGRLSMAPRPRESLQSLNPKVLPPDKQETEALMDALNDKREALVMKRAKMRLLMALKSNLRKSVKLCNGDKFLFWRTDGNNSKSRCEGPATCICQTGSLVVGMIAGNVFTVRASRCKLHGRRATHFAPPFEALPDDAVLPSNSRRNQALNEALDDDAANQFAMAIGEHWSSQGDTTAEGTAGDQVQEVQRRMQLEEDEGMRRIAADEADVAESRAVSGEERDPRPGIRRKEPPDESDGEANAGEEVLDAAPRRSSRIAEQHRVKYTMAELETARKDLSGLSETRTKQWQTLAPAQSRTVRRHPGGVLVRRSHLVDQK
jgi:hypothetical protein